MKKISYILVLFLVILSFMFSCQTSTQGQHNMPQDCPITQAYMSHGIVGFSKTREIVYDYCYNAQQDVIINNKTPITYLWEYLCDLKNNESITTFVYLSEDYLSHCEYLKFELTINDEVYELWMLYDYALNKEYIWYQGNFYYNGAMGSWEWEIWRRGALYYGPMADYYLMEMSNDHVFRYTPYWTCVNYNPRTQLIMDIDSLGPIIDCDQAVNKAISIFQPYSVEKTDWSYDVTTGYWLVHITLSESIDLSSYKVYPEFKHPSSYMCRHLDVILDSNGNLIEISF